MVIEKKRVIAALILLAVAASSLIFVFKIAAPEKVYAPVIKVLNEEQSNVEKVTVVTAAIATGIAVVPGDSTTPVAEKLVDVSGYFIIVLCAIFLEKYLLFITWYLTFMFLFPAVFIMFAVNQLAGSEGLGRFARKLLIFAVAIVVAIPASVGISCLIESSSDYLSVQQNVTELHQTKTDIESKTDDKSWVDKIGSVFTKAYSGLKNIKTKAENALNKALITFAIMIVTSCIIPILTLLFFLWLLKNIFNINVKLRMPDRKPHELLSAMKKKSEQEG